MMSSWKKMGNCILDHLTVRWLGNCLHGWTQRVTVDGNEATWCMLTNGITQGSVLGTVPFFQFPLLTVLRSPRWLLCHSVSASETHPCYLSPLAVNLLPSAFCSVWVLTLHFPGHCALHATSFAVEINISY